LNKAKEWVLAELYCDAGGLSMNELSFLKKSGYNF